MNPVIDGPLPALIVCLIPLAMFTPPDRRKADICLSSPGSRCSPTASKTRQPLRLNT
jgi:hypothetical protein